LKVRFLLSLAVVCLLLSLTDCGRKGPPTLPEQSEKRKEDGGRTRGELVLRGRILEVGSQRSDVGPVKSAPLLQKYPR
jgi:predicted small lipoprotein YifL